MGTLAQFDHFTRARTEPSGRYAQCRGVFKDGFALEHDRLSDGGIGQADLETCPRQVLATTKWCAV